jgi:hypothetical protein
MKQTFSEDQLKPFLEYFVMLENSINKDKPKATEPEKKEETKKADQAESHEEEKQVSKKSKPGKMLNMLLGGALTALGGISLFFLFKHKDKF